MTKIVHVHLLHQSSPIIRNNVINTYTKDGLFCLMGDDGTVEKYPVLHLFRVTEYAPGAGF
jgi:hypothetical protein